MASKNTSAFRPPAVPLVTHDPYLSIWSFHNELNGDVTRHWTGHAHPIVAWIKIDDEVYRLMGESAHDLPALKQHSLEVRPTTTAYVFRDAGVEVSLSLISPLLPDDLNMIARPVTYVSWSVTSLDGTEKDVSIYFEVASDLVVNTIDQEVIGARVKIDGMRALKMGTYEQPVLKKFGDNLRIDWGYVYVATPFEEQSDDVISSRQEARHTFITDGRLPLSDDLRQPRKVMDETLVSALLMHSGKVGSSPVSQYVMVAYDDLFSIEYLNRRLRPYWRRKGEHIGDLMKAAASDYDDIVQRCETFDRELMSDLTQAGGEKYAQMCALAYRQSIAAHKLAADIDGTPLFFSKENFSNGCIATVDVSYPSSPLYMLLNTDLLKAMIRPILEYAGLERWPFPFAPHDLGTYPLANGQVYGGGERNEDNQMPVEECGNMLIMVTCASLYEGSTDFAAQYWETLTEWAQYLEKWGFDPDIQLCTDDFTGHLAHNANLSVKAIVALGAFSKLCQMRGLSSEADHYMSVARQFVAQWMEAADDGDHYRLAFDKPGTWSQKYNLVWDKILELNLFPTEVIEKEIAFYKTKLNDFGLPLDNRSDYTKLDWIYWTATLADSMEDFLLLTEGAYRYADESPSRVPLSDWYGTQDAKVINFRARSVVGGLFIKMLADPDMRKKWDQHRS